MSARPPFWRRQWFAALGIAVVLVMVLAVAARANPTSAGEAFVSGSASPVTASGTVRATVENSPAAASLTPTEGESPTVVTSTAAQQFTPSASTSTGLPGGLTQLVVAPQDTAQVYVRAYFGDGWIDADHDCQDTRAEVLISESTAPVTFTTSSNCTVATGRWVDPWSGAVVTSATQVQIDHDVPLAEAWRSGAWAWTTAQRIAYANDLSYPWHLNAVTNSQNTSKSDSDPAHWKPPLQSTWCLYSPRELTACAGRRGG